MPIKGSRSVAQRAQFAQLGQGKSSTGEQLLTVEQLQQMLASSQGKLLDAENKLATLESTLETERLHHKKCLEDLQLQLKQNADLSALLAAERTCSEELKTRVHVE